MKESVEGVGEHPYSVDMLRGLEVLSYIQRQSYGKTKYQLNSVQLAGFRRS